MSHLDPKELTQAKQLSKEGKFEASPQLLKDFEGKKKIKKIIKNAAKFKAFNDDTGKALKFNIFDDMDGYFTKIEDFATHYGIQAHLSLIENDSSWNHLL